MVAISKLRTFAKPSFGWATHSSSSVPRFTQQIKQSFDQCPHWGHIGPHKPRFNPCPDAGRNLKPARTNHSPPIALRLSEHLRYVFYPLCNHAARTIPLIPYDCADQEGNSSQCLHCYRWVSSCVLRACLVDYSKVLKCSPFFSEVVPGDIGTSLADAIDFIPQSSGSSPSAQRWSLQYKVFRLCTRCPLSEKHSSCFIIGKRLKKFPNMILVEEMMTAGSIILGSNYFCMHAAWFFAPSNPNLRFPNGCPKSQFYLPR